MKRIVFTIAGLLAAVLCYGQLINRAEYCIDSDPGFGAGFPLTVAVPSEDVELDLDIDISGLPEGFHNLLIRARDDAGKWSPVSVRIFYIYKFNSPEGSKLDKAEYFIDADPGFGMATPISILSPGNDLTMTFDVGPGELTDGFHKLFVRAGDISGRWSLIHSHIFYVISLSQTLSAPVSDLEYFFDDDPGFGNGMPVSLAIPGKNVTVDFTANIDGLSDGDHILYFRAKDEMNRWGHTFAHAFSLVINGIGEIGTQSWFRLYPNPGNGRFTIELSNIHTLPVKLTISDMSGREIFSIETEERTLSPEIDLNPDVYLVRVESGDRSFVQKLVVGK